MIIMYFETFVMFIVKFNHKACKYNEINLMSLDKSYLKLYVLMQVGFLCSVYTYFGYTDLSIDSHIFHYIEISNDIISDYESEIEHQYN